MTDLSNWDFAENFSGNDAAALMLGLDPANHESKHHKIARVVIRMKECYDVSRSAIAHVMRQSGSKSNFSKCLHPSGLLSNGLLTRISHPLDGLDIWLNDVIGFDFYSQEFSRDELTRWLLATRMKSEYHFDLKQLNTVKNTLGHWPWGNHHTETLGHLEAAAKRFWTLYEPGSNDTAPTNDVVATWLQNERGISKEKARAIASMLRPDGLPTGPRK